MLAGVLIGLPLIERGPTASPTHNFLSLALEAAKDPTVALVERAPGDRGRFCCSAEQRTEFQFFLGRWSSHILVEHSGLYLCQMPFRQLLHYYFLPATVRPGDGDLVATRDITIWLGPLAVDGNLTSLAGPLGFRT